MVKKQPSRRESTDILEGTISQIRGLAELCSAVGSGNLMHLTGDNLASILNGIGDSLEGAAESLLNANIEV